jgi:hypothetical protein
VNAIGDELDALALEIRTATGWRTTRDPDELVPPIVMLGLPTLERRTLAGRRIITVPVRLVAPAPGDRRAADMLLGAVDTLLDVLSADTAQPVTVEHGSARYPAYTTTARRIIEGT